MTTSAASLISVWAALLTVARVQQGLSQRQVCDIGGFRQSQLCLWESGAETSVPNLIRWADALGFDVELVRREVTP